MNDAVSKPPTLDEQMATFKGFTSVEGTVRPETDAERGVQGDTSTKSAPADKTVSAQDRLSAAHKPAKAAPAANASDAEGDGEGDGDGAGAGQQTEQPQAKAGGKDPQQRINQAVKRQRTAERERDAARAETRALSERLARLEGVVSGGGVRQPLTNQNQGSNNAEGSEPNPANYQYGDLDTRYIADLARFEARKAFRAEQATEQQRSQSEATQAQKAAHAASLREFEAKGLEKYEDFDEVVVASANANEWPLTPTVGELIIGSDYGTDVAYFLATHHDVAHRVAKMTPAKQAAWFGQQEALLSSQSADASTPTVPSQTKAPPLPAARVQGGGNRTQVTADTSDFAAFEAMATGAKH